jgi:hypothetical protein
MVVLEHETMSQPSVCPSDYLPSCPLLTLLTLQKDSDSKSSFEDKDSKEAEASSDAAPVDGVYRTHGATDPCRVALLS